MFQSRRDPGMALRRGGNLTDLDLLGVVSIPS